MSNNYINQFLNMYPWYVWVAVIIVLSFIISVIWIVNHTSKEVKNGK